MGLDPEIDEKYPNKDSNYVMLGVRTLARILAVEYPLDYRRLWVHLDALLEEIKDDE